MKKLFLAFFCLILLNACREKSENKIQPATLNHSRDQPAPYIAPPSTPDPATPNTQTPTPAK